MTYDDYDEPSMIARIGRFLYLLIVGILGVAAIVAGGWVGLQSLTAVESVGDDNYTINQAVSHSVSYSDNSFFNENPVPSTNAYVTNLVRDIEVDFDYKYEASTIALLNYSYTITADVRATHQPPGKEGEPSAVWSRQYELLAPTSESFEGDSLAINESVTVPFRDYRDVIEQFDKTLDIGTKGEVVVTMQVDLKGSVDGVNFSDSKRSSFVAPITDRVLATEADLQEEVVGVIPTDTPDGFIGYMERFKPVFAIILAAIGLGLLIYVYKNRIARTSYQREIEKIYRLHDGIIVHSTAMPDLSNKQHIIVEDFSDLLNLEEELKSPIVAHELSDRATKFFIIRSEVVYEYILGDAPIVRPAAQQKSAVQPRKTTTAARKKPSTPAAQKRKPTRHKKIQ